MRLRLYKKKVFKKPFNFGNLYLIDGALFFYEENIRDSISTLEIVPVDDDYSPSRRNVNTVEPHLLNFVLTVYKRSREEMIRTN